MAHIDTLLSAIDSYLQDELDRPTFPQSMLWAALDALDVPELRVDFPELPPHPSSPSLQRALREGVKQGEPLSAALQPLWLKMRWVTNGNYEGRPEMENYLRNAAYCEIVGSRGLVLRKDVSVGFFYIGPNVDYPAHDHPSPEAYWVLSGSAGWWREDADWQTQPPGTRIFHPPNVSHGMRTFEDPLLTFFVWTGDVASLAQVTQSQDA